MPDFSSVQRVAYLSVSRPRSSSSWSLSTTALSGIDPGRVQQVLVDVLLGRRVRTHVADVVRIRRADMRIEQVVDEEIGRDRALGAIEDHRRVRAADRALLRDVELDRRLLGLDGVDVRAPGVADPDVAAGHVLLVLDAVQPDERVLLLEQREGLVELAVINGVGAEAELDERRCEGLALVVEHRDMAGPAVVPERLPAGGRLLDLVAVVGDARRPPHVRHRMGVARVVARVRPLGGEIDLVRDERQVERQDLLDGDQSRDVGRGREGDVEAGLAGGDPGVHPFVRVEEVGADLDLDLVVLEDLLLERRDDVLAHVLGVVPDVELALGHRHGCRSGRRGRCGRDGRCRGWRDDRSARRCRHGRCRTRGARGTGRDDRGQCRERTDLGDLLQQHPAGDPVLCHVTDEFALEIDLRALRVGHSGASSDATARPRPRTSASAGGQVTATSLPTGSRIPALGDSTVRSSPPAVRSR